MLEIWSVYWTFHHSISLLISTESNQIEKIEFSIVIECVGKSSNKSLETTYVKKYFEDNTYLESNWLYNCMVATIDSAK